MQINAQDLVEVLKGSKNIILHGAPGTGKTHLAKQIAEELGAEYEFIQFHPSYDYTDFVEGLRPINENGQVIFKRKDGIFKEFCKKALLDKSFIEKSEFVKEKLLKFYDEKLSIFTNFNTDKKWKKVLLFKLAYSKLIKKVEEEGADGLELKNTFGTGFFRVYYKDGLVGATIWEDRIITYSEGTLFECFLNPAEYNRTHSKSSLKASIGEYMRTLVKNIDDVKISFDELCEIFSLAKFDDELEEEVKNESDKEKENNEKNIYVFIIDEINRGEISKIFGELFYLIDPDKRGKEHSAKTQYQNLLEDEDAFKDGFYIPDNVYIIATMNDIDRSAEPIDFAFRRRFTWINVKASDTEDIILNELDKKLKEKAKIKMKNLNRAIIAIDGLDENYQIGASYFLKLLNYLTDEIDEVNEYKKEFNCLWEYHLEPLLREYLSGRAGQEIENELRKLKNEYDSQEVENNNG